MPWERNGYYHRDLFTPASKVEALRVPRDREGKFVTEVFGRHKRIIVTVDKVVLEMYLSGISTRKIADIADALRAVKSSQGHRQRHRQQTEGRAGQSA